MKFVTRYFDSKGNDPENTTDLNIDNVFSKGAMYTLWS